MTTLKKDYPRGIDRVIDYFGERLPMVLWAMAAATPVAVRIAPAKRA